MAHDWPVLPDLLQTVREFIDELSPRLGKQDRYHALCSIYLLDIAQRELNEWSTTRTEDDDRLAQWVAGGDAMAPQDVIKMLCTNIRSGQHDDQLDQLFEAMQAHVSAKVRVSRPDYLHPDER